MKKNVILAFILLSIFILFFGCKKKDSTTPATAPPTNLQITLNDYSGNPVQFATVKLFSSYNDWYNKTNQIGLIEISDATGKVQFSNLQSEVYYWFAEKDCINNFNGISQTSNTLTANTTNKITSILNGTGTIIFNSTSSNPYDCFINGVRQFTCNGGQSHSVIYLPTGAYSCRVLQLSGYVFTPTDETFNGNLNCGGTLNINFP